MLGIEVNGPLPGSIAIPINLGPSANETRLAAENEKLRKQLAAAEGDDEDEVPVRRKRRKKVKAKRAPRSVAIQQLGQDDYLPRLMAGTPSMTLRLPPIACPGCQPAVRRSAVAIPGRVRTSSPTC